MNKRKHNTKDNLIPFEKSKRVIRIEQRQVDKKVPIWGIVTGILAIACMMYCLSIYFFMDYGTRFFLIWGVMSVGFGILSFLLFHPDIMGYIPGWIRKGFVICVLLGLLLFCIVEGMIISRFHAKAQAGADYVIVLGAQWKSHGPSYVLRKRLDKAVEYLRENPGASVIVSGGQGANEPMSEAQGMAGYIEAAGIDKARIIQEDKSMNTYENLNFSSALLEKEKDRVVLVTNNFHMFRALMIARKQGYKNIEGLAAGSYPAMMPNNLFREFFGVVKDVAVGNM